MQYRCNSWYGRPPTSNHDSADSCDDVKVSVYLFYIQLFMLTGRVDTQDSWQLRAEALSNSYCFRICEPGC